MKRMTWTVGVGMLAVCFALTGCEKKSVADFDADVVSGTAPLTVRFTDLSVSGSSPITAWHWLFGDGAESTLQEPAHIYTTPGAYNVSLEITTPAGNGIALKMAFIHVTPPAAGTVQTVLLPGDVPLVMVWIPGGSYMMGSAASEPSGGAGEIPQHSVALSGFWMGKYEVTQGQWKAVMGTSIYSYFLPGQHGVPSDTNTDNRPVEWQSWNACQAFVTALNTHITTTGQGSATMRLPSEAEWEYACRAGTTDRFYWGPDLSLADIGDYAWYSVNSGDQTHDVGTAGGTGGHPNAWGLCDMSGNVFEFCQDWYHDSYVGAPSDGSAWESPTGLWRVARGGSWLLGGGACRSALRGANSPTTGNVDFGFRLAR